MAVVTNGQGEAPLVQSLSRGLAIISCFSADRNSLTISDVGRLTGISSAAARRGLLTLVQLGYARQNGVYFSLTPRILQLGYAYLSSLRLPDLVQPYLEALASETHQAASVSVLDGDDIVYVARVATTRIISVSLSVGARLPAYATAMGRVLLADLDAREVDEYLARASLVPRTPRTVTDPEELRVVLALVRQRGWCLLDSEIEEGVHAVAMPLRDRSGKAVAAINVAGHASSLSVVDLREVVLPQLKATVDEIEGALARQL